MTFPGTASHNLPRREDWIAKAIAELRRLVKRSNATLSAAVVPTGGIVMYAAVSPPTTGWLLCNGVAVSRTTYAALYSVVGDTYGAGDGSTTFNLPNFGSAFPRGNSPGTNGGAATHTHSTPNHSHNLSSANGWAEIDVTSAGTVLIRRDNASGATFTYTQTAAATGSTTTGTANAAAGLNGATDSGGASTSGSASSLPPYTGVAFLIKT